MARGVDTRFHPARRPNRYGWESDFHGQWVSANPGTPTSPASKTSGVNDRPDYHHSVRMSDLDGRFNQSLEIRETGEVLTAGNFRTRYRAMVASDALEQRHRNEEHLDEPSRGWRQYR